MCVQHWFVFKKIFNCREGRFRTVLMSRWRVKAEFRNMRVVRCHKLEPRWNMARLWKA